MVGTEATRPAVCSNFDPTLAHCRLEHRRFRERTLFAWYCGLSLGAPLVLLLLLLTAHLLPEGQAEQLRPGIGASKCWFRGKRPKR